MYPDRAAAAQLTDVPVSWLESAAMLHAPSYCFAAEPGATAALTLIRHAARAGIPVSLDASSTGMIEEYGLARYLDLVESLRPAVFFANFREAELLDVTRPQFAKTMTIVKNGAESTTVTPAGGVPRTVHGAAAAPACPATRNWRAGDAFAAGVSSPPACTVPTRWTRRYGYTTNWPVPSCSRPAPRPGPGFPATTPPGDTQG